MKTKLFKRRKVGTHEAGLCGETAVSDIGVESPTHNAGPSASGLQGAQDQPESSTPPALSLRSQVPPGRPQIIPYQPPGRIQEILDVNGVQDIEGLRKRLGVIETFIQKALHNKRASKISSNVLEGVTINAEPVAKLLDRIAKVCFPSSSAGVIKDIAAESRKVLVDSMTHFGNLHWIAGVFAIAASILIRIDQMSQTQKDCLEFLQHLLRLGHHVLSLYASIENTENREEKDRNQKNMEECCSFIAAGAAMCYQYLERGRGRRFAFADTYKKQIEGLYKEIEGRYRDLNLFTAIRIHETLRDFHQWVKYIKEKVEENDDSRERIKEIQDRVAGIDPHATAEIHERVTDSRERIKKIQDGLAGIQGGVRNLCEKAEAPRFCSRRPQYPEDKVGLEEKVTHVLDLLRMERGPSSVAHGIKAKGGAVVDAEKEVQAVLVWGMGGIGKSTLGEAVCARICDREPFSAGPYAKVEIGPKALNTITECQQRIHGQLSGETTDIQTVEDGRQVLANDFRESQKPVLLFIDNIYVAEDLEDLLPHPLCLPDRSRMVLTSRVQTVRGVILNRGISCVSYSIRGLDNDQARDVLRRHLEPFHGQLDSVKRKWVDLILKTCEGVPLILKLIGSAIRNFQDDVNDVKGWTLIMKDLEDGQNIDDRIENISKLTYEMLSPHARDLFLDTCILRGYDWQWAEALEHGSDMLKIQKFSLLQQTNTASRAEWFYKKFQQFEEEIYGEPGFQSGIQIHDFVADFGLRQEESQGRRLLLEDGNSVDETCKDVEKVEGLIANSWRAMSAEKLDLIHKSLRILVLPGGIRGKCYQALTKLQILSLGHFYSDPHITLYKDFQHMQNLRVLNIHGGYLYQNMGLYEAQLPGKLQILKISDMYFKTFHPNAFKNCCGSLRTLSITRCEVENLPDSFYDLKKLGVLVLVKNLYLKSLPAVQVAGLESLQSVFVDQDILDPDTLGGFRKLPAVRELFVNCLSNSVLPFNYSEVKSLEYLCLRWGLGNHLPVGHIFHGFGNLHNLRVMHIEGLPNERLDGGDFSKFTALKTVVLSYCRFLKKLPHGFEDLPTLQELRLTRCYELEELPTLISKLTSLVVLDVSNATSLKLLPDRLGFLVSLRILNLTYCYDLQQLPVDIGKLSSLEELYLKSCTSLKQIPEGFGTLVSLRFLHLCECKSLHHLPEDFGKLSSLEELDMLGCTSLEQLPKEFGTLVSLKKLSLQGCESLHQLPDDIGKLSSLEELDLGGCRSLKQIPEGFGTLVSLRFLNLCVCNSLHQLPEDFGKLSSLEELDMLGCTSLEQLPKEFGTLVSLKKLNLEGCESLCQLPEDIGKLSSLNLQGCTSLQQLPTGLWSLVSSQEFNLEGWKSLHQLPDDIYKLSSFLVVDLREDI